MTKRPGGFRRKTRYRFRKHVDQKGKLYITKFMQKFEVGEKVHLSISPEYQKGMYFPMYAGKTGIVSGQRGKCYEVMITDHKKEKTVVVIRWQMKEKQEKLV